MKVYKNIKMMMSIESTHNDREYWGYCDVCVCVCIRGKDSKTRRIVKPEINYNVRAIQ